MAIETHLRIRGKLRKGVRELPGAIEDILDRIDAVTPVQADVFDLDELFKDRGGIVEPMLKFAAHALETLEVGWMHSDASEQGHRVYRLDANGRTISEEGADPNRECYFCKLLLEEAEDDEVDDGEPIELDASIPTPQWRRKFGELLDFLADLSKQQRAFKTKEDPFIRKWWDLIDLYFNLFEMKEGLPAAQEAKRLTAAEVGALTPYHEALTSYRDANRHNQSGVLDDPKWSAICGLAKATKAKLPKLAG